MSNFLFVEGLFTAEFVSKATDLLTPDGIDDPVLWALAAVVVMALVFGRMPGGYKKPRR